MKNTILRTIKKHGLLTEGMHVVLGFSGGPDSLCLFDVLCSLSKEMDLHLYPVHINHKLRPGAAERDQAFAEATCRQKGLVCKSVVCDCGQLAEKLGITSEEAGRKIRYEAFSEVADTIKATGVPMDKIAIAVAHNADDQCETILFRILRGTGIEGLSGIAYKRFDEKGYAVIRPLLDVTKDKIMQYCVSNQLNPCIDHTNSQTLYTRNKIRLELIPLLKEKFNENIVETVNRMGRTASCDREYLGEQAEEAYKRCTIGEGEFLIEKLKSLHKAIRLRVYNMALQRVGMKENVTAAYLAAIDDVCFSESPSAETILRDGFRASRRYEKLIVGCLSEDFSGRDKLKGWNLIKISGKDFESFDEKGKVFGAFVLPDDMNESMLKVRTRMDGDYITISSGRKKIQDFLVDAKVPKEYRDEILLLAMGSEILWIMPSEYFKDGRLKAKGRFSASYKPDINCARKTEENIIVLEKLCQM